MGGYGYLISAAEAAWVSWGVRERLIWGCCKVLACHYQVKCGGVISRSLKLLPDTIFLGFELALDRLETPIHYLSVLSCTPSIGQTSDIMDNRAIIGSCNVNSFNNFNNFTSFNTTIMDDRYQILQWLSPLEPQKRHQHLRGNRLEGVGQWIFQTNEFKRWDTREDGSSHSVLFCHGDPGVGKTHLR